MRHWIQLWLLSLLILLALSSTSEAATKYWIGSGSDTFTDNTKWSTSSGGANNTTAPTSSDIATFDSAGGNCTISSTASVDSIDIKANYTGTISQTADLTVNTNFTQRAGTYSHTSGTITFSNSGSYATIDVNSSITFYNLTINKPSGYYTTLGSGDTLNVTNTFTASQGYNCIYTGTIVLNNGGSISNMGTCSGVPSSTTIRVDSGTLTLDASATLVAPPINLNGGNATVSGSSAVTLASLTVGNASSTFTQGTGNLTLNGVLTQSNGTVILSSNSGTLNVNGAASLTGGTLDLGTSSANRTFGSNFTLNGGTLNGLNYTGTLSVAGTTSLTTGTFKVNDTAGAMTFSTGGTNFTVASGVSFNNGTTANSNTKLNLTTYGGNYSTTIDVNSDLTVYNFTLNKTGGNYTTVTSGDTITVNNTFTASQSSNCLNTGTVILNNGGSISNMNTCSSVGSNGTIRVDSGTLTLDASATLVAPTINLNGGNATISGSSAVTLYSLTVGNASSTFTQGTGNLSLSSVLTQSNGTVTLSSNSSTVTVNGAASLTGGTLDLGTSSANRTFGGMTLNGGTLNGLNYTGTLTVVGNASFTTGTFKVNNTAGAMTLSMGTNLTVGSSFSFDNGTTSTSNSKLNLTFYSYSNYSTIDVNSNLTVYNFTLSKTGGYYTTLASGDSITVDNTFNAAQSYNCLYTGTVILKNGGSLSGMGGCGGGSPTTTLRIDSGTLALSTSSATMTTPPLNLNGGLVTATGANTLTLGTLTIGNASSTFTGSGNAFSASSTNITAGTLNINGGNFTSSGGLTVGTSGVLQLLGGETVTTPTLNSGSTVKYSGTGASYTIKGWTYTSATVEIAGGASTVYSEGANTTVNNLTLTSGIYSLAGYNLTVSSTFTNNATLRLQGGESTVSLTNDTDSGTVEYVGTSSYSSLKAGNSYYNLVFNGSGGTFQHSGTLDVNGNLTITAGTLNSNGQNVTLAGNWSNAGSYTSGSNTVTLDGTGAQTIVTGGTGANQDFQNFTINKANGTATISTNDLDIDGNFTLTSGTLDANGRTMTVAGNWANGGGTFTANSGSVTLTGTSQTISGSTTFYNLTKTVSAADTLTLTAGTTQTISGTMTMNGASGQLLTIASSTTSTATINPTTATVSYLSVSYNTNSNGGIIACWTSCTNGGNDSGWSFGAPNVTLSANNATIAEAAGTSTITATLSSSSPYTTVINLSFSGSSTNLTDYTRSGTTITINSGNTTGTITLTGVDDALDEANETIVTSISSVDNSYATDTGVTPTVTITDDDATPSVQWTVTSQASADETNASTMTVTAQLSAASGLNVSVPFNVTGTASGSGTDYSITPSPLTITAGSTTTTATITIAGDSLDENDETVILTIDSPTNASVGTNNIHTATITDDDATPSVQWTVTSQASADETNASTMTVTAQLSAASGLNVSVPFNVTGTASGSGTDYSITSSPLTITAGSTTTTATITIAGDSLDENDETVILTIDSPTNASVGTNNIHTATITDDDNAPTVTLTRSAATMNETGGTATLTATLSAASGKTVTIDLSNSGTATENTDYTPSGSSIVISAGDTIGTITLTATSDTTNEDDETIITDISSVTNGTESGSQQTTVTITDDDGQPTITFTTSSSSGLESVTSPTIEVSLTVASGKTVTVDYAVTGGTATGSGTDYTLTSGTLTFNPGETSHDISMTVVNDALSEDNETIIVGLSNISNAATGTTSHTYTITDNDTAPTVTLSRSVATLAEDGSNATITATLSAAAGRDVTVNLDYVSSTATLTDDYTHTGTSITITAGALSSDATVTSVSDDVDETNETVVVDISSVTNGTENGTQQVTVTITDNDTAGVTITQSGGTTTATEGGSGDNYTIVLTSQPTSDVVIDMSPNAQVAVSPSGAVTFTAANWSTPQTITVSAVDDDVAETSPHTGSIGHAINISNTSDANYQALASLTTVNVSITDNDTASISITQTSGSTNITEGAGTDTYTVVLTSEPTHNVTISIGANSQFSTSPSTLTFTAGPSGDWDIAQEVTISAIDDHIAEGTHTTLLTQTVTSTDASYDGISLAAITVHITDNDTPAIVITQTASDTTVSESGSTDTYTISLTSEPTDDVTVDLTVGDGLSTDLTSITFTHGAMGTWATPQTITVAAVDDPIASGILTATIMHQSASSDPHYNHLTIDNITVAITDNDAAGITQVSSTGTAILTAAEGGAGSNISFVLNSEPTANVTLNFAASSQTTLSMSTLTFTSDTWSVAQTLYVSATDDKTVEGSHTDTLSITVTSDDPHFRDLSPLTNYTITITDNDHETVSGGSGGNSEPGGSSGNSGESSGGNNSGEESSGGGDTHTLTVTMENTEGLIYVTHSGEDVTVSNETAEHAEELGEGISISVDTHTIIIPIGDGSHESIVVTSEVHTDSSTDEDIIIGSPYADSGRGMAYIVPRSEVSDIDLREDNTAASLTLGALNLSTSESTTSGIILTGRRSGDHFGEYIATGDVDGDGIPEYLIAAPGEGLYGEVHVFNQDMVEVATIFGSSTQTLSSIILAQLIGGNILDLNFGPDNLALNTQLTFGSNPSSSALITSLEGNSDISGSLDLSQLDTDSIIGTSSSYQYVTVCDMNGDSTNDLIASTTDNQVVIFFGPINAATRITTPNTVITGESGNFGAALSCADVNHDGRDDLMIGAPNYGENSEGAIYVLYGRYFWDPTYTISDEINKGYASRITGSTAEGHMGSDMLIQSGSSLVIYTPEGDYNTLALTLSSDAVIDQTSEVHVSGHGSIFGCTLIPE